MWLDHARVIDCWDGNGDNEGDIWIIRDGHHDPERIRWVHLWPRPACGTWAKAKYWDITFNVFDDGLLVVNVRPSMEQGPR